VVVVPLLIYTSIDAHTSILVSVYGLWRPRVEKYPTYCFLPTTPSARQLANMRRVRLVPGCVMVKVVSVETHCLSRNQGSSTQYLETVRSNIASPHARECIHRLQISFLTRRWVSFCFFAHSSPSNHRLLKSHTLLQARRPSVVSSGSVPPTPTGPRAAAHGPSFVTRAPYSPLFRHVVVVGDTLILAV